MRILVTSHPGLGHVNGLIAIALGLRERGHAVLVAGAPSVVGAFARAGLDGVAIVDEPLWSDAAGAHDEVPILRETDAPSRLAVVHAELGIRRRAFALLDALPDVIERWRPDLVLRDATEFAAWALAERYGFPDVSLEVSAHWPTERWEGEVGDALRELRDRAGLSTPAIGAAAGIYRHLHVNNAPASLCDPTVAMPPVTVDLAPTFFEDHAVEDDFRDRPGQLDGGRALPPPMGAHHAYLAFGSVYQAPTEVVREVVRALAADFDRVLVVGDVPEAPAHVVARPYIPQTPAMLGCSVVLCHGGRNTVLTALRHGVPVVCIPLGSDHFDMARYVDRAGAGLTVGWEARSITAAAREVATDPRFRRAARAVADEIAAMPSVDDLVREMERRFG